MYRILTTSWPIFFGLAIIMVGNGLQGTLLGIRASIEGFDTVLIGLIMSLYYFGFLSGSYYVPKLISKVGHIRVFTALASLASSTVLIHGLYSDPWLWAIIRVFTGFAYAGLYIVVESWLNNSATNKTRGTILSLYLLITYAGLALGQFLINIADPAQIDLFVMTSILVSIAILPICLSTRPAPPFEETEHISLKSLFKISPLGLTGAFVVGIGSAVIFGLGAVYAKASGFSLPEVSFFMAFYIMGGVFFQIPIGKLSDRFDRRSILLGLTLMSSILAATCFVFAGNVLLLNIFMFLFGGASLAIYGQCLAHTNDHLEPRQYVAAISSLILVNGVGAALGPFLVSIGMSVVGNFVFFPLISFIFFAFFIYGLLRMRARESVPLEDQGDSLIMPARASSIAVMMAEETNDTLKKMEEDN